MASGRTETASTLSRMTHTLRPVTALLAAGIFCYLEGGILSAVFFAILLLLSSFPMCLIALITASACPFRFGITVPLVKLLLENDEIIFYPFHFFIGVTAVILMGAGHLLSADIRKPDLGPLSCFFLRLVKLLFYTAGICAFFSTFFRIAPPVVTWGWTMLFLGYAAAFSRIPKLRNPAVQFRKTLSNTALIVVSILFSLLLLETGARLLMSRPPSENNLFQPHEKYLCALAPGAEVLIRVKKSADEYVEIPFRISEQGWRDDVFGEKQPDEFRIIMLGDSYTMGYSTSFEESIPNQLEKILKNRNPGHRITVINCGVMGTGPWQQAGYLLERGFPLEPDLVLHQIFPSNDIENSLMPVGGYLRAYDPGWHRVLNEYRSWQHLSVRTERWFRHNVWSYYYITKLTGHEGFISDLFSSFRFVEPVNLTIPEPPEKRPYFLEVNLKEWYPEIEEGFSRMKKDILSVRQACLIRNVDYIAWTSPGVSQLNEEMVKEKNQLYGDIYDLRKPFAETEAFFEAAGIPSFSVLRALQTGGSPEEIFFLNDGHYSPKGCTIVAETIRDWLMEYYFPEKFPEIPAPADP